MGETEAVAPDQGFENRFVFFGRERPRNYVRSSASHRARGEVVPSMIHKAPKARDSAPQRQLFRRSSGCTGNSAQDRRRGNAWPRRLEPRRVLQVAVLQVIGRKCVRKRICPPAAFCAGRTQPRHAASSPPRVLHSQFAFFQETSRCLACATSFLHSNSFLNRGRQGNGCAISSSRRSAFRGEDGRPRPRYWREERQDLVLMCHMGNDSREGHDPFLNKRPPRWRGE